MARSGKRAARFGTAAHPVAQDGCQIAHAETLANQATADRAGTIKPTALQRAGSMCHELAWWEIALTACVDGTDTYLTQT